MVKAGDVVDNFISQVRLLSPLAHASLLSTFASMPHGRVEAAGDPDLLACVQMPLHPPPQRPTVGMTASNGTRIFPT